MSTLTLGHKAMMIERKSFCSDLWEMVDADFSGENGIKYASEETIKAGFDSNYAAAFHCASEMYGDDMVKIIDYVLKENYGQQYYYENSHSTIKVNDNKVFVSLAYTS